MSTIIIRNVSSQLIPIIHSTLVLPPMSDYEITKYFCDDVTFWLKYFNNDNDNIPDKIRKNMIEIYEDNIYLSLAEIDAKIAILTDNYGENIYGKKDTWDALVPPTVNDDEHHGYGPGSHWADVVANNIYLCISAEPGVAVWVQLLVEGHTFSYVTSVNTRTGAVVLSKTDVGLGNVPNVDATNATNITSGTLSLARLPDFPNGSVITSDGSNLVSDTAFLWDGVHKRLGIADGSIANIEDKITISNEIYSSVVAIRSYSAASPGGVAGSGRYLRGTGAFTDVNDWDIITNGTASAQVYEKISDSEVYLNAAVNWSTSSWGHKPRTYVALDRDVDSSETGFSWNESGVPVWQMYTWFDELQKVLSIYNAQSGVDVLSMDVNGHVSINKTYDTVPRDLPKTTLSVFPQQFDSIQKYVDSGAVWSDLTADLQNYGASTHAILEAVDDFLYIGKSSDFANIYFVFNTFAIGASLKLEYSTASGWSEITIAGHDLEDNTVNMTANGYIYFDRYALADGGWVPVAVGDDTNEYYYVRISTVLLPTTAPIDIITIPGQGKRVQIYAAPLDTTPTFEIDARGHTGIDGHKDEYKQLVVGHSTLEFSDTDPGLGIKVPSQGGLYILNTNSGAEVNYEVEDGSLVFGTISNHPIYIQTNDTEVAAILTNGNMGLGDLNPNQKLVVVGNTRTTGQMISDLASGTSPFSITSVTLNTNLNADLLDGNHATAFATAVHTHTASEITNTPYGAISSVTVQNAINELSDDKQPLSNNLTALGLLNSSAGFLYQTGLNAFTKVTLTAGSSKIAITMPGGVPTIDATEANFTLNNIGGTLGNTKGGTNWNSSASSGVVKVTAGVWAVATAGTDYSTPASSDTFTNKTFDANGSGNDISNIETDDFAANVIDTDSTLAANSDSRLATQRAVKAYVATAAGGMHPGGSVRAATTGPGTLASDFENGDTIDTSITLATNDEILIKNQADPIENGIYVVQASGAPVRRTDADTGAEIKGILVIVLEGTANGGSSWANSNLTVPTVGVDAITFAQTATAGGYTAGTGLSLASNVFSITALTASRAVVTNGSGNLAASSVTATQIGYLSDVTGAIQSQLNGKEPTVAKGDLTGDSNGLTVTDGTGAVIGTGTSLALAQDIQTTATPQFAGVITGYLKAIADGTTAIQFKDTSNNSLITLDTTNMKVLIGDQSQERLTVSEYGAYPDVFIGIDSASDLDRGFSWGRDGNWEWALGSYVDGEGRWLYMNSAISTYDILNLEDSGRVAINLRTEIPQLQSPANFAIYPQSFDSVLTTPDNAVFTDHTLEASQSWGTPFTIISVSLTDYIYVGKSSKFGSVAFHFSNIANSSSLVQFEYWDGNALSWVTVTPAAHDLVDSGGGLTKYRGTVTWSKEKLTDWEPSTIDGNTYYWGRFRAITLDVTGTIDAYAITPNGIDRFNIFTAGRDTEPIFAINPFGKTFIGNSYNLDAINVTSDGVLATDIASVHIIDTNASIKIWRWCSVSEPLDSPCIEFIKGTDTVTLTNNMFWEIAMTDSDLHSSNPGITFENVNDTGNTTKFMIGDVHVNNASRNATLIPMAVGNMNGTKTINGILLDVVDGVHTGSNNYLHAINISGITQGANATQTAINIGSGWQNALVVADGAMVGLGVAVPTKTLDIAGTIGITGQLTSTLATGTAPFVVASTTLVTNLNADLLDGFNSNAFATAVHNHSGSDITSGAVANTNGGTGANSSAFTGFAYVSAGTWTAPYTFDTDSTLTANSNTRVPAQSAVKTYVDARTTIQSAVSEGESSWNTDINFQTKVTLSFTPGNGTTWMIYYVWGWSSSATNQDQEQQAILDDVTIMNNNYQRNNRTYAQGYYNVISGVQVVTFSDANVHTVKIQYRTANTGATAYIRRARIFARRVS